MPANSWNCPSAWWIAGIVVVALVVAGVCARRYRRHVRSRARQEAQHAAREAASAALQETILQSSQGLILRMEAIARGLPADHPARRDITRALDRAERLLEKGRDRAQHLRPKSPPPGGPGTPDSP